MGFRFRLHRKDLPGKPDVVLQKHRSVVFVHGCFWHRHPGCSRASTPSENRDYWLPKFERTIRRDERTTSELRERGWNVVIVWECELKNADALRRRLFSEIADKPSIYDPEQAPLLLAAEKQTAYGVPAGGERKDKK
jgi:DNA mismatch endonuclease (patch repair protein)